MPEFYDYLPQEVVQRGYELYENFQSNIKRDAKGAALITDIFLVATGHGLEFVQKNSLKGLWLGFVKSVKSLVGIQDDSFAIEKNLEVASKLLATATNADDKYFEILAHRLSVPGKPVEGKNLRHDLLELGLHLRSLKGHVESQRALQGKDIRDLTKISMRLHLPQKAEDVAKKHLFASEQQFYETTKALLISAIPLAQQEIDEVVSVLCLSAEKDVVLTGLERAKERKRVRQEPAHKDLEALHLALMKAMPLLSPQRATILREVLRKIEPRVTVEEVDLKRLEKFAKVFGDSFIYESGFEGDWSSRPYADLLEDFIKTKMAYSKGAQELLSILESRVDLRAVERREQPLSTIIKQKLLESPTKRCLLLGGWQEHALVYEIQQKPNGKYAFRVYNEGEGIEQHDQLKGQYKDKYRGCIAIGEIPEHLLFQEAFLASLEAYGSFPKGGMLGIPPDQFLNNHLLVMLDGSPEPVPEKVKHFLSPQRSGTCTYRSILAFVASFMPEEEYKFFKFDFKLHLLQNYLPQLVAVANMEVTHSSYLETVRQYNTLARAMEKYASGLLKLKSVIPDKKIAEAELLLMQYKTALIPLQEQIFAYERAHQGTTLGQLTGQPGTVAVLPRDSFEQAIEKIEITNAPFKPETLSLLAKIDAIPLDVESCLNDLRHETSDYFYLVDRFFRKMGSIHAFDRIALRNPQQAVSDLEAIVTAISHTIKHNEQNFRAERHAQFFFAGYLLEGALKKLPEGQRVLMEPSLSILKKDPNLIELQTSDPFYSKVLAEVRQLVETRPEQDVPFRDLRLSGLFQLEVELDPKFVQSVISWWNGPNNAALRARVDESVRNDRVAQQRRIEDEVRKEKRNVAEAEAELARLGPEYVPASSLAGVTLARNVASAKEKMERARARISQIPSQVKNDRNYWPEGFEKSFWQGGMSDEQKVSFFIGMKKEFFLIKLGDPLLPVEFRTFCSVAILCNNIFRKNKFMHENVANFHYNFRERKLEFEKTNHSFHSLCPNNDVHLPFIQDPKVKAIHYEIQLRRNLETNVANAFAKFEERQSGQTIDGDEAKELFSIRARPEVQLEAVLSYFGEHLDKLADNDWLNIFHALLFESDLLYNELQSATKKELFLQRARHFFTSAIKNAMLIDDLAQAANLLWMAKEIDRFSGQVQEPLVTCELYLELVGKATNQKFATQWPVIYEALLASLQSYLTAAPQTDDDKKLFAIALFAHIMCTENPPDPNSRLQLRYEAASHARNRIKERLSESGGLNPNVLGRLVNQHLVPLLQATYPEFGQQRLRVQMASCIAPDNTTLALIDGLLIPATPTTTLTFTKYLSQADEQHLRNVAVYDASDDLSHLRTTKQGAFTYIKDSKKNIIIAKGMLGVFIKVGADNWRSYFEPDQRLLRENNELLNSYYHLQEGNDVVLVDRKTLEPIFRTKQLRNRQQNKIVSVQNPDLHVVLQPQSNPFQAFEGTNCTLFLADKHNKVQKVIFPRHNIALERRGDSYVLEQDRQWHLAREQFLPHFGKTTGFLLFENDMGEKKAIVPVWNPMESKERALNFPFEYELKEEKVRQGHYVECEVMGISVIPKTLEARFHLAKIYLEKGRIDEAEKLLESSSSELTSRKLTKEEYDRLEKLSSVPVSKDIGSRALRQRIRAYYLLTKNEIQFPTDKEKTAAVDEEAEKIEVLWKAGLCQEYLARLGHIPPMSSYEELTVLPPTREKILAYLEKLDKKIKESQKPKELKESLQGLITTLTELARTLEHRILTLRDQTLLVQEEKRELIKVPTRMGQLSNQPLEIPLVECAPRDMISYTQARKGNVFPFNPFNITFEEWRRFFPIVKREVEKTRSYSTANNNGLLSTLYYLTFFARDQSVRADAQTLLGELLSIQGIFEALKHLIWPKIPMHAFQVTKRSPDYKKPPELALLETRDVGLFSLMPIKASEQVSTFLSELAGSCFSKEVKRPEKIDAKKLFDPNCPQAKGCKAEFEKAAEDVLIAQEQAQEVTYRLTQTVDGLLRTIDAQLRRETELLAHHEQVITESVHSALTATPEAHLEFLAKKRPLPSIQELCVLAAKGNFYPELSASSCEKLKEAAKQYLLQKQFVQQLTRAKERAQEGALNPLGAALETKLAYSLDDPLAMPFLIIETSLNITLRSDQVDNIRKFAVSGLEGRAVVLQAIMGSGKSSVWQPLLAYLFATPDALSTVMVPEALLEPVRTGLENALGTSFQRSVFILPYDRELAKKSDYIGSYLERLKEIRQRGGVLLFTPRQKHSIITSLYEAYYEGDEARVNQIAKICNVLQFEEVAQVDEIDFVMNPFVIFKYPLGSREVVDTDRATLLSELVVSLAQDQTLAKKVSIDFVAKSQERQGTLPRERAPGITKEQFLAVVQPTLVANAIALLLKKGEPFIKIFAPGYDREHYLQHFLTKSSPFDDRIRTLCIPSEEMAIRRALPKTADALERVSQDESKRELERLIAKKELFRMKSLAWILKEIPGKPQRELLGVMAHAISDIMPNSLLNECGTNYGIDIKGKKYVARPYEAAGSPKPTQYSNPYEQVIYSTQLALYYGVSEEASLKILSSLQNEAKIEMHKNSCSLAQTESYARFLEVMGPAAEQFSFLELPIPKRLADAFKIALSKEPKWLLFFLRGYVYPQISRYSDSLSNTPQGLVGCSKRASGYTGTLHEGVLARGVQSIAEVGTDGKTINAVENKKPKIDIVKETSAKALSDYITNHFLEDKGRFVWTDSDGWLKDENIEGFTEKLLVACEQSRTRKEILGIVYHNEQGAVMVLQRDATGAFMRIPLAESALQPQQGKLLTIIQQKYETGTNIPQTATAKDDMNVRKGMTKRDALQSIFRMRQILAGQRVDFPMKDDVQFDIAAQIIEGLLANPIFRRLLSSQSNFDLQVIDQLKLEPKLADALKKAMGEFRQETQLINQYRGHLIKHREFVLEFLNRFVKYYTPDSTDLWRYFVANQAALEREKNWLAGRQRMRESVERPIRMALTDTRLPLADRQRLFTMAKELYITQEADSPFISVTTGAVVLDAKAAIDKEVARYMAVWDKVKSEAAIIHNARAIYKDQSIEEVLRSCVDEKSIPEVIVVSDTIIGQELEQEAEEEKEVEIERQVETERETKLPDEKPYRPLVSYSEDHGYKISEFLQKRFDPVSKVLPKGLKLEPLDALFISPNLFIDQSELGSKEHGTYHLPGRFLLAIQEAQKPPKYLLVSHEDAARIKKGLYHYPLAPNQLVALYTFDGQVVAATDPAKASQLKESPAIKPLLAQAKVLCGRMNFTREEITLLASTLRDPRQAQFVRQLYERIIKYKPSVAKRYIGSHLERELTKLAV